MTRKTNRLSTTQINPAQPPPHKPQTPNSKTRTSQSQPALSSGWSWCVAVHLYVPFSCSRVWDDVEWATKGCWCHGRASMASMEATEMPWWDKVTAIIRMTEGIRISKAGTSSREVFSSIARTIRLIGVRCRRTSSIITSGRSIDVGIKMGTIILDRTTYHEMPLKEPIKDYWLWAHIRASTNIRRIEKK